MASRRTSPFAAVRPAIGLAGLYGVALVVWLAAGAALPGGRWFAVHLFTLGVLSNLVMAMTQHFAETLMHQPASAGSGARAALFNAGALGVLVGIPTGTRWLVAAGAPAASAAVLWLYVHLRRVRKAALTQRFAFLVRGYERATSAFLHGALLGALLGAGVLTGPWAGTARLAHLHINVLGWGGLTLLSTLVVFGPTVLRARMADGADAAAAQWLGRAATGLTVGVIALLLAAAAQPWGTVARLAAAAGLALYATGCVAVCRSVLAAARRAKPSASGLLITAVCAWFPLVAWADVLVVAGGRFWLLPAVGAAMLVGVLGQAILATLGYLAPMLAAAAQRRDRLRQRVNTAPRSRAAALNVAVIAIAGGTAAHAGSVAAAGWVLFASTAAVSLVIAASAIAQPVQTEPAGE